MRLIAATVATAALASAAAADIYQIERIQDNSMSCDELVAEVEKVEAEINAAAEDKLLAKRAMDAERESRYSTNKSSLGELLSTTADVLEGVQTLSGGEKAATPRERYDLARETERNATYRRRHLIQLHRESDC